MSPSDSIPLQIEQTSPSENEYIQLLNHQQPTEFELPNESTVEIQNFDIVEQEEKISPRKKRSLETFADIASTGVSAVEMIQNPSWENAGYLSWDLAATMLPFVPASYTVKAVRAIKSSPHEEVLEQVTTLNKSSTKGSRGTQKSSESLFNEGGTGKGVNNPVIKNRVEIGQEAHRQLQNEGSDKWLSESTMWLKDGTKLRKDGVGIFDPNEVRIIKPDTPTGRKAAEKRAGLMKDFGFDPTIDYYDPLDMRFQPGSPTYIGPKNKKGVKK